MSPAPSQWFGVRSGNRLWVKGGWVEAWWSFAGLVLLPGGLLATVTVSLFPRIVLVIVRFVVPVIRARFAKGPAVVLSGLFSFRRGWVLFGISGTSLFLSMTTLRGPLVPFV